MPDDDWAPLRDEHGIAHGHASAIVHEYDKRRGARRHA